MSEPTQSIVQSAWALFWQPSLPWLIATVSALTAVIYLRRPEDRRSLGNTVGLCALSLGGVLFAAGLSAFGFAWSGAVTRETFVIVGGMAIIRLWGLLIFRLLLPAARINAPRIVEDLIVIIAYVAWVMVRLRVAGLDLSGIVATSAVITAIVAFSMQDTLGNILGGLALELDSAFEVGDWIRVDDLVGRVVDIRWRSTSIETRDWETVVVPNSHLVRSKVVVLGRRRGQPLQLRRKVWFNVSLSNQPARVIETVESALRQASMANVAVDPAPNCVLMAFEHGYGRYAARYWLTDLARDDPTDSAVREHVFAALQRAGMRIAVPEQDIHVVQSDDAHAQGVRARELERRIAALRTVDLFNELTAQELRTLAASLVTTPFAAGDTITRQGAMAHWLYILTAGSVEVRVAQSGEPARVIATLSAPTVFGEMGLLTGAPRRATVIARTSVECYRLDKSAFEGVLMMRPELAERMSRILAQRQEAFERGMQDLDSERHGRQPIHRGDEILERIKSFFGLLGR